MGKKLKLMWSMFVITLYTISYSFGYSQEQINTYEWAYQNRMTTFSNINVANINWEITKQELAKILVNYVENVVGLDLSSLNLCSFSDENKFNKEFLPYSQKACTYGIMWSNWKPFDPNHILRRDEVSRILFKMIRWSIPYEEGVANSMPPWEDLDALKFNGIMNDISHPWNHTKRWDILIMLKRINDKFGENIKLKEKILNIMWNWKDRDVTRKNEIAHIQTAIITSQQKKWEWPGMTKWATKGIPVSLIKNELLDAWMSYIPKDPYTKNIASWLWTNKNVKWEYTYLVAKRNWADNGWFALIAKTETEWESNWVVCWNRNSDGSNNGRINTNTDLATIKTCKSITKVTAGCKSNTEQCEYSDGSQLRYILYY